MLSTSSYLHGMFKGMYKMMSCEISNLGGPPSTLECFLEAIRWSF